MLVRLDGASPRVGQRVFVAPGARVIGHCTLGDDVGIWFNAVLRGDLEPIEIGDRSNVQDCAVLHTDRGFPCLIGRDVTIGHGAIVHGATVGDGALIGMGAIILSGARIGPGALVAAGALVPEGREIPGGWLAMGTPAKAVRELTAQEKERIARGALHYVQEKDRYLRERIGARLETGMPEA
jgi:Carbonic anhydrases/acetyltransferases, isoleucine patch superfamily